MESKQHKYNKQCSKHISLGSIGTLKCVSVFNSVRMNLKKWRYNLLSLKNLSVDEF